MPAFVGGGLPQVQVLIASLAAQQQARQQEGQGCVALALHQPGKQGLKAAGVCVRHLCHEAAAKANILSVPNTASYPFASEHRSVLAVKKHGWLLMQNDGLSDILLQSCGHIPVGQLL